MIDERRESVASSACGRGVIARHAESYHGLVSIVLYCEAKRGLRTLCTAFNFASVSDSSVYIQLHIWSSSDKEAQGTLRGSRIFSELRR